MKWVCWIVGISGLTLAVVKSFENTSLERRIHDLEYVEKRSCCDKYKVRSLPMSYWERQVLNSIKDTISSTCFRECSQGLQNYAKIIGEFPQSPSSDDWTVMERALHDELHKAFLRSQALFEFENARQLEGYLRVNYDLALYFGYRSVAQREFEILPVYENLPYATLMKYREKYAELGRRDLLVVVERYLAKLIDHIESPEGFTRVGARQQVLLNTELANTLRPGTGVSHESALKIGRAIALGLVNCGYTPKWLDEEFPLPSKDSAEKR